MSDKKALVLCSGGVDSTTLLAMAVNEYGAENVYALSISYGQKHLREIEAAKVVASYYGVEQRFLDLGAIFADSQCSLLTQSAEAVPHGTYAEQQARAGEEAAAEMNARAEAVAGSGEGAGAPAGAGAAPGAAAASLAGAGAAAGIGAASPAGAGAAVSTYVPFRNGLFLSAAASMALSLECSVVYYGAHHDDVAGNAYPDCSLAFVEAMNRAIAEGTGGELRLEAPFVKASKADIVRVGLELAVPYELTWSCYEGGDVPCGQCATCLDRAQAFAANNAADPALK